jgi:hypothetical protein
MAARFIEKGEFKITYRADCLTEGKYVGPRRDTIEEAEADAASHLATPGNEDHQVEIEITQRSYM